jgi:hypothetical protein
MRNHQSHPIILFAVVGAIIGLSMSAEASELDDLTSISSICRYSDPVPNPFQQPSAERPVAEERGREEPEEVSTTEDASSGGGETVRRVYSSRSSGGSLEIALQVHRDDAEASGEDSESRGQQGQDDADVGERSTDEASPIVEAESAMRYARERRRRVAQTWETVVDSSQFRVVSYDQASETLVVSLNEPLEVSGGLATVRLPEDDALMFALDGEGAELAETQWRAGSLELWLRYELIARERPEEAFCGRNGMGGPEVRGALLEAVLLEPRRGARLAEMKTQRAVRERCSRQAQGEVQASPPGNLVHVQSLESLGSASMTEAEAVMLTLFAELVLGECYFDAKMSNAALEGAVVVNFELDGRGLMNESELVIDALRSERFRECALDAFATSMIPRVPSAPVLDTRMTVIFASDER